ncbi:prepilin-type N-terminal cleavage/methylation domain-containing protein [bacterium]|nr:prepilin-type N-terminal cleavage/methylation domain-containing protein [bacterium]
MFNKKSAFTLAEVLLVLAIIGVIAAVTIPAIMQQSSEKKFAALAKKTMSTLQNAIDLKMATVPVGPGDLQMGLLEWLLDGEDDGTNTLKGVKVNNNSSTIQFPDGVIVYWGNALKCTNPTTPTDRLGCNGTTCGYETSCAGWFRIDLNGADPPTKTTLQNANAIVSAQGTKGYDQIWLNVSKDGKLRIYSQNPGSQEDIRAKKYLGL